MFELKNLSKYFGSVIANEDISLKINEGEILALLGENGSGKTTLMNMLAGLYFPDSGQIFHEGEEIVIKSPKDASDHGIGMIHQHFKLVDLLTAAENVILGLNKGFLLDREKIEQEIKEVADMHGFNIDPKKKVYNMTVSEKQTLEIVKVLYRGANLLILDEPTAVLTPQEAKQLFKALQRLKERGKAIVLITHKMNEVLEVSDNIAVLRKGRLVARLDTKDATELKLAELMVGEKVSLNIKRSKVKDPVLRLEIRNLSVKNLYGRTVLDDVSFDAYGGEILGIAGISGSGQKELLEAIAGLEHAQKGSDITYYHPKHNEVKLIGKSPLQIKRLGISLSFVPEDRLGMGLVGSMGMVDNVLLRTYDETPNFYKNRKRAKKIAKEIKDELAVSTPSEDTAVQTLSGGNVQKVLVGREIANNPIVFMTAYAVRGLDINTSYVIYDILNKQKEAGVAVIYVGEDLDVLLALSDKILVLSNGSISKPLDPKKVTKEEIGLLMTNKMVKES